MADNSSLELFDDGSLLFSGQEQQLSQLEGAGTFLVPLLERGTTICELAAKLVSGGLEAGAAEDWTTSFLHQLATLSLVQVVRCDSDRPKHHQQLELGSFQAELWYSTDELRNSLAPIFTHLERESVFAEATFQISDFGGGLVAIRENDNKATLVPRDMAGVRLKAILLERIFGRSQVAALHAGLVHDDDGGILLLGSPGAGKSTLALVLLRAGYNYGSDDVTLINPDGTVTGLPLAPGMKEGSWAIAEEIGIQLTEPAQMRPDGRPIRFAQIVAEKIVPSGAARTIISLHRKDGVSAELRPMSSHEALGELLRESRSTSGACSVETMGALARLVRGSAAFHLHYSEATEVARLIAALRKSERDETRTS